METRWRGVAGSATRVALAYVALSSAWVLLSDWWLGLAAANPDRLTAFQMTKGLGFVALSGVLIFGLVRREQRQLAATNEDLERTLQHATVLHRLLRHNLRNSCDVIRNNVDLLRSGRGDDTDSRERIRRQAVKLSSIADKTRHLRGLVSDDGAEFVEQDPATVVEESVTAVRRRYPEATFVLESSSAESVVAHPRLSVAVEELLTNAVVHHDGDTPQVSVECDGEGDEVVLRVSDDGPGLPDVERTVLEDGVEEAVTHSRGIGLWVVRFVVTASGGSLAVPSADADGTVISVRLPTGGEQSPRGTSGPEKRPVRG